MINWIKERASEASSHQGLIVVVAAAAIIWGGLALLDVILWGALAWGIWSMVKKDY